MTDDLEHDESPPHPGSPQILWGRVLVLLLALALAFWLGTTFGGDAGARTTIIDQRNTIGDLEAQVAALQAQVAAVDTDTDAAAPATQPPADAETEPSPPAADDTQVASAEQSEPASSDGEYVVQSGDTLAAIAQEVYGDPSQWLVIATANGLQAPYALTVGDTLTIPEEP